MCYDALGSVHDTNLQFVYTQTFFIQCKSSYTGQVVITADGVFNRRQGYSTAFLFTGKYLKAHQVTLHKPYGSLHLLFPDYLHE